MQHPSSGVWGGIAYFPKASLAKANLALPILTQIPPGGMLQFHPVLPRIFFLRVLAIVTQISFFLDFFSIFSEGSCNFNADLPPPRDVTILTWIPPRWDVAILTPRGRGSWVKIVTSLR